MTGDIPVIWRHFLRDIDLGLSIDSIDYVTGIAHGGAHSIQNMMARGVRHQPKSCTRFRNPKISGKISDFSHFILKTFCSFLLCYHSNNKIIQLLADFSKQRIKYLVLKLWFLTHALVRNYTVSSLMILEILNFA